MTEKLTLKALSSLTYPPRHHVIICHLLAYSPPPPPVMTSFMNSPLLCPKMVLKKERVGKTIMQNKSLNNNLRTFVDFLDAICPGRVASPQYGFVVAGGGGLIQLGRRWKVLGFPICTFPLCKLWNTPQSSRSKPVENVACLTSHNIFNRLDDLGVFHNLRSGKVQIGNPNMYSYIYSYIYSQYVFLHAYVDVVYSMSRCWLYKKEKTWLTKTIASPISDLSDIWFVRYILERKYPSFNSWWGLQFQLKLSKYISYTSYDWYIGDIYTIDNSQSLEDTQVGYISQKYTWDKYTLDFWFFENFQIFQKKSDF